MPCANLARMSAVAGTTTSASMACATAMCSMAESIFDSPASAPNMPVMTFSPESAAKVSGRTNSCAACVMTTCTWMPRSWSRRRTSAALYAAMPPLMPSVILIGAWTAGWGIGFQPPISTPRRYPAVEPARVLYRTSGRFFAQGLIDLLGRLRRFLIVRNDPLDLAGADLILRDATGFAGTGFNHGRGAVLKLPGTPGCDQNVAIVAVEPIDQLHVLPQRRLVLAMLAAPERVQNRLDPIPGIVQTIPLGHANFLLIFFGRSFPRASQSFREYDGAQFIGGLFQAVVHQNIVVFVVILNLLAGRVQPAVDDLGAVQTPIVESPLQFLAVRGQYKDADGAGNPGLYLGRPLHVDVEQQVVVVLLGLAQEPARRAVVVAEHVGVLEELVVAHHAFEFLAGNKEIFAPVLLAPPGLARSVGDREIQALDQAAQLIDQGRFSGARWRRDDEDRAHSTFCTCSRDFSISDLMDRPISVICSASPARPEVFDSRVLASRFISCSRKSSFLPTSPPSSSRPRKCFTCVSRRTSSSWMSLRSTSRAASCSRRSESACAPTSSCMRPRNFST